MMVKPPPPTAAASVLFALSVVCNIFGQLALVAQAQNNQTQAATDPNEVALLNSIFQQWGIAANQQQWNISGKPCSGAAIDSNIAIDNPTYNPFIKCLCSFNNNTLCHITELKVYSQNVVGVIPDELWNLTFLTNLDLRQNYLTGPLSSSIANLTAIQYLSVGINALSGELPKELELLTELIVLGIGTNNFSGSLPSELGNLSKLEQLYLDSSGVSGEIPSSFANLQSLKTVWASDTELTGRIPDFIGNWSQLLSLRFQGNSFEGPIPSSFSNLTSLTELRISDVSNMSSTLAFIRNMTSLSTLELRNNNISDSIPSNIGQFQSLQHLDLSFNNLSGQIPELLFNLSSLSHLFLGNDKLNGTLPAEKSPSLLNVDVSYNNLLGSFPSWISEENLQINLVANNFTLESSDSSVLPHGLNCLQRNFPCNRGSGIYSSFAVKCGGPQITSSNGIEYERDNETLGPATYYVTEANSWGVSNVGYFTGTNSPQYKTTSSSQFTNTLDSELFQTARISPSSLRYYGLGLQNGNYTVTLQFAEITILDTNGWESLGRRLFNVYVQGNLVLKDFDIKKEAGGASKRPVERKFTALVSENYLEIHLFWAGKGTCCVPAQGTYGPLISAISATPDFIPTVSPPSTGKNRTGLIVGIVVGGGVASFLLVLAIFLFIQRRKGKQADDEELLGIDARPYTFSYAELRTATEGFSPANKLGEGGFGPVYKGKLNDGRVIAVKQLSLASHQGKSQFVAEIATISAVQHRNLVKLYGCCLEGAQRLLVYEYLENNSLDRALFETVLNSIFQQWGLSASQQQWNISGEPCSGAAIDSSITWDNEAYNPFIKCLCSFNNDTLCHITVLKVTALNVVGAIPDELWTLTFLKILNLGLNYLTGNISASIKNLTQLEGLYLNANAFSGNLPIELGELKNLTSMSFAENNFSGSLPYMIGTLSKLKQLYFSSSGVTGAIPSSFAGLQNMETLWASDNDLTGRIPEFIGLWTKLIDLRLQGNSFEGPIPSTFSNLTWMQELRISDLSNGSSSLVFIKDMKSLNILVLRNCHISGVIPSNIREYRNLTLLDLSFNNISGEIPGSLFGSSSLVNLLLGNNKITGFLPLQKSSSIMNIDLSYNNLSGTALPSWIEEKELQLNLAANYFNIESLNSSVLPRGLHCLQRTFSCNQNSVLYKNFSINSGGPQFTSSNGIVFEGDNESLGPATYFVADTYRWAVSNVGFFASDHKYTCSTSSVITNTFDSELYQTSRISASSLRYYGLGLENGKYNVTLLFAETAFPDTKTWQNRGRRVFDIYIQGKLVQKDFDIKKMAGGTSFRAYQIEFNVQVMQNYLEIHLYWAGKGTCCIPYRDTYGPAISAITAAPVDTVSISHKNPQIGLIVGTVLGSVAFFLFVLAAALYVIRGRKRPHTNEDIGLNGIDAKPYIFSYDELRTATEDFNPSNKLGEGGFGPVFKGTLSDGEVVAVKQLSVTSRQGKVQFAAEIAIISSVQHRNLVKLHGCCINGDKRLVVYEYLENKSLDQALFGKRNLDLNWPARFNICLGVAKGLAYLHEESRHRIVHRDIKAGNILLDSNLDPKISDFGLAKLYDNHKTHISTCVAGTFGYLAPEYALFGHLTEKVDVFSFGVLLLEIISGRPNTSSDLEEDNVYLLNWAWQLHEKNGDIELMDSRLTEFNEEEAKRVIGVAFLCTQAAPMLRPLMSHVVAMLLGDIEVTLVASKPAYLTDWNFNDMSNFMSENRSENYTSATSYMLAGEEQSSSTIHMVGTDKTSSEGTLNTKRPEIIEESG